MARLQSAAPASEISLATLESLVAAGRGSDQSPRTPTSSEASLVSPVLRPALAASLPAQARGRSDRLSSGSLMSLDSKRSESLRSTTRERSQSRRRVSQSTSSDRPACWSSDSAEVIRQIVKERKQTQPGQGLLDFYVPLEERKRRRWSFAEVTAMRTASRTASDETASSTAGPSSRTSSNLSSLASPGTGGAAAAHTDTAEEAHQPSRGPSAAAAAAAAAARGKAAAKMGGNSGAGSPASPGLTLTSTTSRAGVSNSSASAPGAASAILGRRHTYRSPSAAAANASSTGRSNGSGRRGSAESVTLKTGSRRDSTSAESGLLRARSVSRETFQRLRNYMRRRSSLGHEGAVVGGQ